MTQEAGNAPTPVRSSLTISPTAAVFYRGPLTAADILAEVGALTITPNSGAGGDLTAVVHTYQVVAGNAFGRTKAATVSTDGAASTGNTQDRVAWAAVPNAVYYDIFGSIKASFPDPLWIGRVTEAQRAAGGEINTIAGGYLSSNGAVNSIDIGVVGSGLAAGVSAGQNTAYTAPPQLIRASGYEYLDLEVVASRTGDAVALAITLLPMLSGQTWTALDPITLQFGGLSGAYESLIQSKRIAVRGRACAVLVASIAGTGASVNLYYSLS